MSEVCVHGLGYIGLPTAAVLANYDHDVAGFDVDDTVRNQLNNGDVHLEEAGLRAFVTQALESGRLEIVDQIVAAQYHIVCVPTPFDGETNTADLSYVRSAGETISRVLREGDTVILESTVPPGTTEDVLRPILEESGLIAGEDFGLAFCPETVLPGNIISELQENNRIVGGVNGVSRGAAVRLYETFVNGEIRTTAAPTTAELVKLIQNTYRDTNIALANEFAKLAHDYGVDSREAIDLANEHPRVDVLEPGPGVGGHCLPVDPWFLEARSDEVELISTARRVNDGMTEFIVRLLEEELDDLSERHIAILGIAYKGNVEDTRMSPGIRLAQELMYDFDEFEHEHDSKGPDVSIHDPHVDESVFSTVDLESALSGADAAVVTTDHDEFVELSPDTLSRHMKNPFVLDTKGILDDEWKETSAEILTL